MAQEKPDKTPTVTETERLGIEETIKSLPADLKDQARKALLGASALINMGKADEAADAESMRELQKISHR
ncbi:MAG: hypothetical protein WC651_01520 [Candidatus Gracilibacteria bacterium]|jgi:hypothetical protein